MKVVISSDSSRRPPKQWMSPVSKDWRSLESVTISTASLLELLLDLNITEKSVIDGQAVFSVYPGKESLAIHFWIEGDDLGQLYITTAAQLFWVLNMLPAELRSTQTALDLLDKYFEESVSYLNWDRIHPNPAGDIQTLPLGDEFSLPWLNHQYK